MVPVPKPKKPDRSVHLLGKYLSLISLLPSGAFAGYLIASFAGNWWRSEALKPIGLILGIVAAMVKIVSELLREGSREDGRP